MRPYTDRRLYPEIDESTLTNCRSCFTTSLPENLSAGECQECSMLTKLSVDSRISPRLIARLEESRKGRKLVNNKKRSYKS